MIEATKYSIKNNKIHAQDINCDFDIDDNYIIKCDSLRALEQLKPSYKQKIKFIYCDVPYNTKNSKLTYDDTRSDWSDWMGDIFKKASTLLRQDGILAVHIGHNEYIRLKIVLDHIFKIDNYIGTIYRKTGATLNSAVFLSNELDFILLYAKDKKTATVNKIPQTNFKSYYHKDKYFQKRGHYAIRSFLLKTDGYDKGRYYPISYNGKTMYPDWKGKKYHWRWVEHKFKKGVENGFIIFRDDLVSFKVMMKNYEKVDNEGKDISRLDNIYNLWDNPRYANPIGSAEIEKLFGNKDFTYPKPEALLKDLIYHFTNENDIVLDAFAGSGTTGSVAHKMKRKFVMIEKEEYVKILIQKRLLKVLQKEQGGISQDDDISWNGGEFIYIEIE